MGYFGNDYRAGRKREFGPETQKAKGAFGFLDSNYIVSHSEYFCSVLAIFIFAMPCAAYGLFVAFFQDYSLDTNTNLVAGAGGRGSKEPDKKDEIIRGRRIAISGAAPVDSRQLPLRQCPPGSHRFDGTTDSSSFTPEALICNLSRQARS